MTKDKDVGGELIGAQHERVALLNVQLPELLEGLVNEGHYETLRMISMTLNVSQLRKYIFPSITKIEHCKGFHGCLKKNGLLGDFFAHVLGTIGGEMEKAKLATREKLSDLFQILEFVIGDVTSEKCIPAIKRFLVMHGNGLGKRHIDSCQKFYERLGRDMDEILWCWVK